eukprot:246629-Chlamydomonas_euryale.AAC.2
MACKQHDTRRSRQARLGPGYNDGRVLDRTKERLLSGLTLNISCNARAHKGHRSAAHMLATHACMNGPPVPKYDA